MLLTGTTSAVYSVDATSNDALLANEAEDNPNDIVLKKTYDGNGTLTLETYATGEMITTSDKTAVHSVLVLDTSGSMSSSITVNGTITDIDAALAGLSKKYGAEEGIYTVNAGWGDRLMRYSATNGWQYRTTFMGFPTGWHNMEGDDDKTYHNIKIDAIDALKIAAKEYVDLVYDNYKETKLPHQIAIVSFDDSANTEIGLTAVNSDKNYNSLISAIDKLRAGGATGADYGMEYAYSILNKDTSKDIAKQAVLFTDGSPTHGNADDDFSNDKEAKGVATDAIKQAYKIKNDLEGVVYSVLLNDGETASQRTYLNGVSSNYPKATAYETLGAQADTKYHLTVSTAAELSDAFQAIIIETIQSACKLTEKAVVMDEITPYFKLPDGVKKEDIKVYTSEWNGTNFSATRVPFTDAEITIELGDPITKTLDRVSVSNFNFSDECCVKDHARGRKLIIEIPIVSSHIAINEEDEYVHPVTNDKGELQYYLIDTNTKESGIYQDGQKVVDQTPVVEFDVPNTELFTIIYYMLNDQGKNVVLQRFDGYAEGEATPAYTNPTPEKAGYDFTNWDSIADLVSADDAKIFPDLPNSSRVIAYQAHFTAGQTKYAIEYYVEDDEGNIENGNKKYTLKDTDDAKGTTDEEVSLDADKLPKFTGYTANTAVSTLSGTVTADGKLVLKVFYDKNEYTVTYKYGFKQGDDDIIESKTQHYLDATFEPEKAPTRNGYKFDGWDKEIAETVTEDAVYTAQWIKVHYTVRVFQGSVNVDSGKVDYSEVPYSNKQIDCEEKDNYLNVEIDPAVYTTIEGCTLDTKTTKAKNGDVFATEDAVKDKLNITVADDSSTVIDYYVRPYIITVVHEDGTKEYYPVPTGNNEFDITDKVDDGKIYGGITDDKGNYFTDKPGTELTPTGDIEYHLVEIDKYSFNYSKFVVVSRPESGTNDGNGKELNRITDIYAINSMPSNNFKLFGMTIGAVRTDEFVKAGATVKPGIPTYNYFDVIGTDMVTEYKIEKDGKTVAKSALPTSGTATTKDGEKAVEGAGEDATYYGIIHLDLSAYVDEKGNPLYLKTVTPADKAVAPYTYYDEIMMSIVTFWVTPDGVRVPNRIATYQVVDGQKYMKTVGVFTNYELYGTMTYYDIAPDYKLN